MHAGLMLFRFFETIAKMCVRFLNGDGVYRFSFSIEGNFVQEINLCVTVCSDSMD